MASYTRLIKKLQAALQKNADNKTREWWENYVKGARFRGVKMKDIRSELHKWYSENVDGHIEGSIEVLIALRMFESRFTEDKLAGILYLQEILIPRRLVGSSAYLDKFAGLFQEGHLNDWNICDWFCVKVLGPLAELEGKQCALGIAAWSKAENLWQRRASGVAFVNLAADGEKNFRGFTTMLLGVCNSDLPGL